MQKYMIYGEEEWNRIKSIEIGDVYTFGTYEQDNNATNGKENIEWIVKEGIISLSSMLNKHSMYVTMVLINRDFGRC